MALSRRQILAGSASLASLTLLAPRRSRADGSVRTWKQYAAGGWGQIHMWMAEPASHKGAEPADGPRDKPPLVCLHQSPTSGAYYKEFQAVMAKDRLVISPDTPGYGGSTAPPSQPVMEDYGRAMVEAMNDLGYGDGGAKGPIDVLGFHTGNFVAIEMARQQPNLIRKMVMPGIPYFAPDERPAKAEQYAGARPYFTDPDYMRRSYQGAVYNNDNGVAKDRQLEMFVERLRSGTKSHYGFVAVFRYNPDPVLKALDKPVLLPILNETLAEPTRISGKMIKNAEFVELMDLDGLVWFLAPERLATVVRPFLDET
jgi:pimeloyl-ACP methyl ester carboxylesterase